MRHLLPLISRSVTTGTTKSRRRKGTSANPASLTKCLSSSAVAVATPLASTAHCHLQRMPVHEPPNSFGSALRSCADRSALMEGRGLHACIISTGFNHDTILSNHMINMYGKCGSLGDARLMFEEMGERNLFSWNTLIGCYCKAGCLIDARELFGRMPCRDSVTWNVMISGYDQHGPWEEALGAFVGMRRSGCGVDHVGVSSVISACSNLRLLADGKQVHGLCAKSGLASNIQVGSALVGLYGKCMEIECARKMFDGMVRKEQFTWNSMLSGYIQCQRVDEAILFLVEMPDKNLVSWTTIITGCSQHDRNEEAIEFYYKMLESGLKLDEVSAVSVLVAYTGLLELDGGCKLHGFILKNGFENNDFIGSVLVVFYAKCGSLEDASSVIDNMSFVDDFSWSVMISEYAKHGWIDCACNVFGRLEVKSLPLWNAMMTAYSEVGFHEKAFETFRKMCLDGVTGDEFTFACLLKGSDLLGVRLLKQLHLQAIKVGVDSSDFVRSALIDMYCRFSDCATAKQVFDAIKKPNIVLWNTLISGYGLNNLCLEAISLFQLMNMFSIRPDKITFSCLLDSCSSLPLTGGMQFHALAHKLGFESDVVVGSAIINMYGKCEKIEHAFHAFSDIHQHNVVSWSSLLGSYVRHGLWISANEVFNLMPERNLVSWNTMLSGHARQGSGLEALRLYCQMNQLGVNPDHISFVSLLTACSYLLSEGEGKQVHGQAVKTGLYLNRHVFSALSDMYRKFGNIEEMKRLFSISHYCIPGNFQDKDLACAVSWEI